MRNATLTLVMLSLISAIGCLSSTSSVKWSENIALYAESRDSKLNDDNVNSVGETGPFISNAKDQKSEEEQHAQDAPARLYQRRGFGVNDHALGGGEGAGRGRAAPALHLHQAQPAGASGRKVRVMAQSGDGEAVGVRCQPVSFQAPQPPQATLSLPPVSR